MSAPGIRTYRNLVFTIALSVSAALAFAQEIDYKGFPEWSWQKEDSTEYYLYTPAGIEPGEKYPIVLFLHGCCGVDYHATLRNTVDPPVRMWHNFGENTQAVPTYLIAPKTSRGWSQHFENLKRVMDRLVAGQQGDPQRIYVCGFSMGGNGTFAMLQRYPGYFAAAIPMGMSFRGDSTLIKDIPIWAHQGETDWFARDLARQIGDIRALNGLTGDTGSTWITGVNPRYSNFKGVGHGVQWIAASTQDLTAWAYSKVNDGNKYPVVFFEGLSNRQRVNAGEPISVKVVAHDRDGSIERTELFLDSVRIGSRTGPPWTFTLTPRSGDHLLEARAIDDRGKASTATLWLKSDIRPQFTTAGLPDLTAGEFIDTNILAIGNGAMNFALSAGRLPEGILLYPDGTLRGVTMVKGKYRFRVTAGDEDGETVEQGFTLRVHERRPDVVLITGVKTIDGKTYPVSRIRKGETPNFDSEDTVRSTALQEINFSDAGKYEGFAYIKGDIRDANRSDENFLTFSVSDDVDVFVAYEKLDHLLDSTTPHWLAPFAREPGEIVAQYRYFAVFHKRFPKGKITLPGADAGRNGVASNYFIIIRKAL